MTGRLGIMNRSAPSRRPQGRANGGVLMKTAARQQPDRAAPERVSRGWSRMRSRRRVLAIWGEAMADRTGRGGLDNLWRRLLATTALTAALALHAAPTPALAQDATWLVSPASSNYSDGTNWTGGSVPAGTATFGVSAITALTFSLPSTPCRRLDVQSRSIGLHLFYQWQGHLVQRRRHRHSGWQRHHHQ